MTLELLWRISGLFSVLFILGTLACIPLYKDFTRLRESSLWTKIIWWIPIFLGFVLILFGELIITVVLGILLIIGALREFRQTKTPRPIIAYAYLCVMCVAFTHLILFWLTFSVLTVVYTLLFICFASVLSDVMAFFMGNYFGKHPLPKNINEKKYWEGVVGQIVGALLGCALVSMLLLEPFPVLLAVTIGVASAVGDLANSFVKRSMNIKDWGNTIPGHGGILDRFSSLATAILSTYWLLQFI